MPDSRKWMEKALWAGLVDIEGTVLEEYQASLNFRCGERRSRAFLNAHRYVELNPS